MLCHIKGTAANHILTATGSSNTWWISFESWLSFAFGQHKNSHFRTNLNAQTKRINVMCQIGCQMLKWEVSVFWEFVTVRDSNWSMSALPLQIYSPLVMWETLASFFMTLSSLDWVLSTSWEKSSSILKIGQTHSQNRFRKFKGRLTPPTQTTQTVRIWARSRADCHVQLL